MDLKQILEAVAKLPVPEQKLFADYCAHFFSFSATSHKCFPNNEQERIDWMRYIPNMVGIIADSYDEVLVPEKSDFEQSATK